MKVFSIEFQIFKVLPQTWIEAAVTMVLEWQQVLQPSKFLHWNKMDVRKHFFMELESINDILSVIKHFSMKKILLDSVVFFFLNVLVAFLLYSFAFISKAWIHIELIFQNKKSQLGPVAQHVIPVIWEAKVYGSPEAESSRPAWPTWRNPTSTKNIKRPGHGGACL